MRNGCATTRLIIPWIVTMGSNTPPACTSPQELMDRKELFFRLWNALNSLPEIQGRRVDAHLILGKSYRQIAREEGVDKSAVRCSVKCGIERMKKYLQENF